MTPVSDYIFLYLLVFLFAGQAEQKKHEEEEVKKQENELAFKAWLMRKREQVQEERRIHRAQEMERMSSKVQPHGGALTFVILFFIV